ncbi:hypothetical protein [Streptomyces sp. 1222.5]|uniref:hypothetical protein n=1 Tax=Streptomyces sp. 1222.5 TaxID=1881026 RepID=UPI003EB9E1E5
MRHRATAVLLAAACLALASCGSDGDTADAKPTPKPTVNRGDKFMASVLDAHLDSYTDGVPAASELKAFPPQWCDALDAGHSVEWMLSITDGGLYPVGQSWGTEQTDAYRLVLLGVHAYCPKWEKDVREQLRESGEY